MSRPEHARTYSTNLTSPMSSRLLDGRLAIVTGASRGTSPLAGPSAPTALRLSICMLTAIT